MKKSYNLTVDELIRRHIPDRGVSSEKRLKKIMDISIHLNRIKLIEEEHGAYVDSIKPKRGRPRKPVEPWRDITKSKAELSKYTNPKLYKEYWTKNQKPSE